jgi:hypothetical protein
VKNCVRHGVCRSSRIGRLNQPESTDQPPNRNITIATATGHSYGGRATELKKVNQAKIKRRIQELQQNVTTIRDRIAEIRTKIDDFRSKAALVRKVTKNKGRKTND